MARVAGSGIAPLAWGGRSGRKGERREAAEMTRVVRQGGREVMVVAVEVVGLE
jgi:hypothetical protein